MSKYSLLLVIAQFALIGLLVWNSKVILWEPLPIITQFIGIGIALWGVLTIKIGNFNVQPEVKSTVLITKGPYRLLRNPMYTGIILVFLPSVILNNNLLLRVCYFLLIVVLLLKVYREEQLLQKSFGGNYVSYKKKTWRLIPFIF